MITSVLAGLKVAGTFVSGLFGTLFKYAGLIFAYFAARRRVQMEMANKQLEQARRANEIDEEVARMSDSDLDRELRNGA